MELAGAARHRKARTICVYRRMSPAGMEPAGAVRHRRSPEGASVREERESIEPSLCAILTLANPLACRVVSPAGMEPAGAVRHRRSPQGELSGESESIE